MLKSIPRRWSAFSVYPNTTTVAFEQIDGKRHEYDTFFHRYSNIVKAFLERRSITKKEICELKRA